MHLPSSPASRHRTSRRPTFLALSRRLAAVTPLALALLFALSCSNTITPAKSEGASPNPQAPVQQPTAPSTTGVTGSGYYAQIVNLTGKSLKDKLHDIINAGITRYPYTSSTQADCWDELEYTDEDPANPDNVIEIYTGWSVAKANRDNGTNDGTRWNKEHVYAKSHGNFGTAVGPGTDLHHLRPADKSVNTPRGNLDFDVGGAPYTDSSLPAGVTSGVTGCSYDIDSFEPRDEDKGDIARMCFYMAVMYDGSGSGDPVDLELNEQVGNDATPFIGKLSVLKAWNLADPPSSFEKRRNDRIQERQGNRNPFIDHPEWVREIWGD